MADTPTTSPGARILQCAVVTPERAVLDEPADFVALPMYDGELGVLPGRAALIGRLGIGELRMRRGSATKRLFVDGGFAQVRDNVVTVLTPNALEEKDIKPDLVQQALEVARAKVPTSEEEFTAKERELQRGRAKMHLIHLPSAHVAH